ncbi:MAG: hypothetical protein JXL97_04915 [Bacteroidales bacterium]|nr:hypothetical protein [Bacteroidales bacterium]
MKKYLIFIAVFFAACSNNKTAYYTEQYKSYENSIDVLNENLGKEYWEFNENISDHKGLEEHLETLDEINEYSENILEIIDEIRIDLAGTDKLTAEEVNNLTRNYKIDAKVLGALKLGFMDFEKLTINIVDEKNETLRENISKTLDTERWNEIEGLNGEVVKSQLMFVVLAKLYFDVLLVKYDVYRWFFSRLCITDFRFNKIEPVILTEKYSYDIGETVKAKIYLVARDTMSNPLIYFANDEIPFENGVGIYKKKITQIGKKIEHGNVVIQNPATGEDVFYPFTIEYEVVN